jgi:hypothetical protein
MLSAIAQISLSCSQVEVIALALANPPPPDAAADAPGPLSPRLPTAPAWPAPGRRGGGMLVVTPPAILQQWANELGRHAGLRVVVYDGLKWHRQQVRPGRGGPGPFRAGLDWTALDWTALVPYRLGRSCVTCIERARGQHVKVESIVFC